MEILGKRLQPTASSWLALSFSLSVSLCLSLSLSAAILLPGALQVPPAGKDDQNPVLPQHEEEARLGRARLGRLRLCACFLYCLSKSVVLRRICAAASAATDI